MADEDRIQSSKSITDDYLDGSLIKLKETQEEHFRDIQNILESNYAYVDTSPMGSGKTIIALGTAGYWGFGIFVICPKSTQSMWIKEAEKYGINVRGTMTYQKLTGTGTKGCSHGLLNRVNNDFSSTHELHKMIEEGTLFIFDEMHALKNPGTGAIKAAHSIVKEVVRMNAGSRVALLSATPFDKENHAQNMLKMMGIITDDDLYYYDPSYNYYEPLGITEAIKYCDEHNRAVSEGIHIGISISNKTCNKLCYDLLVNVVKAECFSSMDSPKILARKDAMNGYYWMPQNEVDELRAGVDLLSESTNYEDTTRTVNIGKGNFGMITTALIMIEKAKINTMIRLARETLESDPNCKVILYVWYIDSIKRMQGSLKEYNPMVMYGETKITQRDTIIENFQEDSNTHRLLISNAKVGGIGISLDDRSGKHPRHLFMIPTYNFIDLHQATGRIHRTTTLSDAHIRFIYSKEFRNETSILNALARKSLVTKSVLFKDEGIVFPGEYESYVEERNQ